MKTRPTKSRSSRQALFLAAALVQMACLVLFVFDILTEMRERDWHTAVEIVGVVGLCISVAITLREYRRLLVRNTRVERELDAASGAFASMMEANFNQWGLTPAERDVALMSVKGLSVADIAALRRTAKGTIKAQCAAIYRKANVSNRAELISVMIEDLIAGVALPHERGDA